MDHLITLDIERLSDEGRGMGFIDGKTVFVRGALPGERVVARVEQRKKRLLFAKLDQLLKASPERVTPPCALFDRCGGCQWQHLSLPAQRAHRQASLLARLKKFAKLVPEQLEPMIVADSLGYRQRVKWRLSAEAGGHRLGFRALKSHQTVSVSHCPVLAPALNQALERLQQQWLPSLLEPCTGTLAMATDGEQLGINPDGLSLPESALQRLRELALAEGWLWHGEPSTERASALQWPIPSADLTLAHFAGEFSQVNAALNDQLLQRAMSWLSLGAEDRVLDLFCGMGNFSLTSARLAGEVIGLEAQESLVVAARANAARAGLGNARFKQADLYRRDLSLTHLAAGANVVIIDPPRSGLQSALPPVLALAAEKVLYVSCDPVTLARDAAAFAAAGYRLSRACNIDFFPHTEHSEAMALFTR